MLQEGGSLSQAGWPDLGPGVEDVGEQVQRRPQGHPFAGDRRQRLVFGEELLAELVKPVEAGLGGHPGRERAEAEVPDGGAEQGDVEGWLSVAEAVEVNEGDLV